MFTHFRPKNQLMLPSIPNRRYKKLTASVHESTMVKAIMATPVVIRGRKQTSKTTGGKENTRKQSQPAAKQANAKRKALRELVNVIETAVKDAKARKEAQESGFSLMALLRKCPAPMYQARDGPRLMRPRRNKKCMANKENEYMGNVY